MGVKNSTADLFINNCDEFLYYDDLVRAQAPKKTVRGRSTARAQPAAAAQSEPAPKGAVGQPKALPLQEAFDEVEKTLEALADERGPDEPVWASMIKQAIKRRNPGFNETYHGFKSFNSLLEEAAIRGLLRLEHDEKSGGYIVHAPESGEVPA